MTIKVSNMIFGDPGASYECTKPMEKVDLKPLNLYLPKTAVNYPRAATKVGDEIKPEEREAEVGMDMSALQGKCNSQRTNECICR